MDRMLNWGSSFASTNIPGDFGKSFSGSCEAIPNALLMLYSSATLHVAPLSAACVCLKYKLLRAWIAYRYAVIYLLRQQGPVFHWDLQVEQWALVINRMAAEGKTLEIYKKFQG